MGEYDRHGDFEINYIDKNHIKITKDDCSITTEYFEKDGIKRKTMGPADIFFSAFAL